MEDKPLTRNTSIVELGLTIAGFLVVGGMAWGSLATEQENLSEKIEQEHEALVEISDDVEVLQQDVASMKTQVDETARRTERIEQILLEDRQ